VITGLPIAPVAGCGISAGVYAMWYSGGLRVDYSANGGATWGPPLYHIA
jgi:hypothetical protein